MKWCYIFQGMTWNAMTCHEMWYCMACHDVMLRDWELVRFDFEETARVHPCFINSWIILFCGSNLVWCKNIRDVARVVPDACNECRPLPCLLGELWCGYCIYNLCQSIMYMSQETWACTAFACILFGSKVILAATCEKALFVPLRTWVSRGSLWPQFDWSKEKTIQNIPVKCVCWSARRWLATENQKQNITRPLNKMTQMITTLSIINQKVGGMGVFSLLGELDQIYLAKMATDRSKKQTETNVWTPTVSMKPYQPTED